MKPAYILLLEVSDCPASGLTLGSFHAELVATNPLNCPLALANVRITIAESHDLATESLAEVVLEPYETRLISLPIKVDKPGTITIQSVKFDFHRFFPCEQTLARKGRRLHSTKQQRIAPTYANDTSLRVEIGNARPIVSARLEGLPQTMYVGEQVTGTLEIRNEGSIAFSDVQLFVNEQGCIRLAESKLDRGRHKTGLMETGAKDTATMVNTIPGPRHLSIHHETVPPGESVSIPIIFALSRCGSVHIRGLIIAANETSPDDLATATFSHTIDCQPLISITSATQHSRRYLGQHLVDVEISNDANTPVSLESIAIVSPYWNATLPDL